MKITWKDMPHMPELLPVVITTPPEPHPSAVQERRMAQFKEPPPIMDEEDDHNACVHTLRAQVRGLRADNDLLAAALSQMEKSRFDACYKAACFREALEKCDTEKPQHIQLAVINRIVRDVLAKFPKV